MNDTQQNEMDALRSLPQNADAERAVLSCALQWPDDCVERIADAPGGADIFYTPAHRTIWKSILALRETGKPVDLVSLSTYLHESENLEKVGGGAALSEILDDVPSKALLDDYLVFLEKPYQRRAGIKACSDAASRLYDSSPENDPEAVLAAVATTLHALLESGNDGSHLRPMREVMLAAVNELQARHDDESALPGLATGFTDLDEATNGFPVGKPVVIAARPGMGKTAFAFQTVLQMAANGVGCAVFSAEMYAVELAFRAMSRGSKIDGLSLSRGELSKFDFGKVMEAAGNIASLPIRIDDSPNMGLNHIVAATRKLVREHGVKVVMVDYLQLIREPEGSRNRVDAVSSLMGGLTRLAKETGVVMIVLSQLNRESANRKGGKPSLSDLRDAGKIEEDAFGVILLHHKEGDDRDDDHGDDDGSTDSIVEVDAIVAKWRGGRTGPVPLTFFKPTTTFENRAYQQQR